MKPSENPEIETEITATNLNSTEAAAEITMPNTDNPEATTEPAAANTKKTKKKLIRHFFLIPPVVAFVLALVGNILGELLLIPFIRFINDNGTIFLLMYASFIGIWIVVLPYCALLEKPVFKSFGHAKWGGMRGNNIRNLMIGLLIGMSANGLCALIAFLHGDLKFSFSGFYPLYLLFGLICVFIQSSAEELVMRGYLMGAIRERYGLIVSIILNTLVFTLLHGANPGITLVPILQLIVFSVLASIMVSECDSLWMAMGIHAAWNYTQSLLLGLPNSGIVSEKAFLHLDAAKDSIFYSTAFGIEGGITSCLADCLIILAIILITRKLKKRNA